MLRCGRSRVTGWEISRKCDRVSRAIESGKVILTSGELGDTSGFFKVICFSQSTGFKNTIESFQILRE